MIIPVTMKVTSMITLNRTNFMVTFLVSKQHFRQATRRAVLVCKRQLEIKIIKITKIILFQELYILRLQSAF